MTRSGHETNLYTLAKRAELFVNNFHSTDQSGLTPIETTDETAPHVLQRQQEARARLSDSNARRGLEKNPFRLGEYVVKRLPEDALSKFRKVGDDKYTSSVYQIVEVKDTEPRNSYRLRPISGGEAEIATHAPSRLARIAQRPLSPERRSGRSIHQPLSPSASPTSAFPVSAFTRSGTRAPENGQGDSLPAGLGARSGLRRA